MPVNRSETSPKLSAFISYSKQDQERAQAIADALEKRGIKCWIAPRDVKPGRTYGDEIIRGIEKSRDFILVLSKESNRSAFVAREVERAVSKNKSIFTVRIDDVTPAPALELFISGTQWIDAFAGKFDTHIDRLAHLLLEEEDDGVRPGASAEAPATRRSRGWRSPFVLGGAGAALLAGLALVFLLPRGNILPPDMPGGIESDADFKTCDSGSGIAAIDACDRAIGAGKFAGNQLSILYNDRGYLRMMAGSLDAGLADLNEAIRIDPYGPYAYWNRGEIYRYKGDLANAKADYERALSLSPREEHRPRIEAALSAVNGEMAKASDPSVISDPSIFGNSTEEVTSDAYGAPIQAAPVAPAEGPELETTPQAPMETPALDALPQAGAPTPTN